MAALTPTKLLVTSKHSVGPTPGASGAESHAQVGERWLRKHLEAAGKTEEQLAQTLWEKDWTAVAELCDDSFEEHVLPYSADKTGLHLHGLNTCTKAFQTQPQSVVDAFAHEWGFIPTASTVLHTIPDVKAFTGQVAHSGQWNGEAIEGFVVRTHVTAPPTKGDKPASLSPYPVGSSFFFKVKFDEPYLMYRDWREVTKTLLSKGPSASNVQKGRLRRPETRLYVEWVCAEIKRDRSQFESFTKGKGIIATRERFLKWMESGAGKDALGKAEEVPAKTTSRKGVAVDFTKGKVIIVPVAIPGVGKTSVAVGLQHLFGFGHVQSDDITAKKAAPVFIKNVTQALKRHDVVIADKNNHLKQHRAQLREAASTFSPPAHLLALHWPLDLPRAMVHRICGDRILARGDRHQTLHAGAHEKVLWQFLDNADELQDAEVDAVVGMDVEEPLEDALARAVGAVVKYLGKEQPDHERMGQALAAARAYESRSKGGKKGGKDKGKAEGDATPPTQDKKTATPRYYGILAEVDLQSVVAPALEGVPSEAREFWEKLVQEKRVQARPHITLVHSKQLGVPAEGALWARCRAVDAVERAPLLRFRLGHVVWSERVMAATVVDLAVDEGDEGGEEVVAFVGQLSDEVRERLHVTVGTRDKNVPPVEARDLVVEWKRKGDGKAGVWAAPLTDVWVKGRVKGLFQ
ncbi:RNA ligase-domain-containing protein [Ganoderma leucocontextum]|nr:RNA ligase-domain-containing protein [Ganoderma leucocontextum]